MEQFGKFETGSVLDTMTFSSPTAVATSMQDQPIILGADLVTIIII